MVSRMVADQDYNPFRLAILIKYKIFWSNTMPSTTPGSCDNSFAYSLKTQRDETSCANKKAESQHGTRIVTKGPEETAKKFLKHDSGNIFKRGYQYCMSRLTKENPAPPVVKA